MGGGNHAAAHLPAQLVHSTVERSVELAWLQIPAPYLTQARESPLCTGYLPRKVRRGNRAVMAVVRSYWFSIYTVLLKNRPEPPGNHVNAIVIFFLLLLLLWLQNKSCHTQSKSYLQGNLEGSTQ